MDQSLSKDVCEKCGHEMEVGDYPYCPHGSVRRSARQASGFPFTTTHFDGKPVEVTSEGHLRELCKIYDVTHRPDVAWVEKRITGYDRNSGKPIYKEGSGAGLPGCWV